MTRCRLNISCGRFNKDRQADRQTLREIEREREAEEKKREKRNKNHYWPQYYVENPTKCTRIT